jgi:hypothetical protein
MTGKTIVPSEEIAVRTDPIEVASGLNIENFSLARPDLAGLRVTSLTRGPIYLVNPEGLLQWVPNPPTYNNLFRDWNGVISLDTAPLSIGTALSDGAILAKGHVSAPVYIISNGKKRWITSPAAMDKYYFAWERIYVVPQVLIDSIPTGNSWS